MGSQVVIALGNVKAFRGYDVTLGTVQITDGAFVDHLDSTYPDAVICNSSWGAGQALYMLDGRRFQEMKGDYQEELQNEMKSQMRQGNDVDIDWHE